MKPPPGLHTDHTRRRLPVASSATVRRNVIEVVRHHRRALVGVLLWHVAAALTALSAPWVVGHLVDEITGARRIERVNQLLLVLVVGLLAQTLLTWFARRAAFVLAETIFAKVREDFVASTVRLPLSVVERAGTGDLVARTTGDVDALAHVVRMAVPSLLVAGTSIVAIVVAALFTAPRAVVAFVVAPVLLWHPVRVYLRRALPGYQWERATYETLAGVASETVQGLTTLVDNTDSFSRFDPTDQMVVVRLYGSFTPDHSRPLGAPLQPAGVMTTVYDATLGVTVMNSFDGSPMNSAQAGTGDAALKQLGTPISIDVTAITP